jgi:biopolymer transport protein ExbD
MAVRHGSDLIPVMLIIFLVAASPATVDVAVDLPTSTAQPQPLPLPPPEIAGTPQRAALVRFRGAGSRSAPEADRSELLASP